MLIINADDFGKNSRATDNILTCFKLGLVTSTSAMVYMGDSQRAAELSNSTGLETGLHLNLTLALDGPGVSAKLIDSQHTIIKYYQSFKCAQVVFNPFLMGFVDYVFKAQYDEYSRIFGKAPARIDGHHHAHLFLNVLLGNILPRGLWVRRSMIFKSGEKNLANRTFRRLIDAYIARHYCCTDHFFSLGHDTSSYRLATIMQLARTFKVEIAVHPEINEMMSFLRSDQFKNAMKSIPKGNFKMLSRERLGLA